MRSTIFCVCGRSKNQPFCDGSHAGTQFKPKAFTADQDGDAYLCVCKHTGNAPYCDGTHKRFSAGEVGKEGPGQISGDSDLPVATPTREELTVAFIHQLAREGLSKLGHHGPMISMGVPRHELPHWDDLQIMAAQMATKPLMEDQDVATELVVGPQAKKPLGADGVAISNSAMQAIGCVAARMCNTNNCPAGIATQKADLWQRLNIQKSSLQLQNFSMLR